MLMRKYFLVLATGSSVLLVLAFALGLVFLWERSQGQVAPQLGQPLPANFFTYHMAVALLAVLATLFTHCLVFTYLLGTGKWVKEVASAYGMPMDGWPRQTRQFKIDVNRGLLLAMFCSIAAAVTGAGSQTEPGSWWSPAHAAFAVLVLFSNGFAFWKEYLVILANEQVLVAVKAEADRLRGDEE